MTYTNNVILIGSFARDPEFQPATDTSKPRFTATVAGETVQMTKDGPRNIPFYHRIQAFGALATMFGERDYLAGDPVMVQGQLRDERWTGEGGQKLRDVRVTISFLSALAEATVNHTDGSGAQRMAGGMNAVELRGNLTEDAVLRRAPSGDVVLNLRIAVNEKYRDRNAQIQERTDYFQVSLWGQQAEALSSLKQGDPVFVMGSLSDYHDKDNKRRHRIEASFIQPLFRVVAAQHTNSNNVVAGVPSVPVAQSTQQPAQTQSEPDDSLPDLDALPAMPSVESGSDVHPTGAEAQLENAGEAQAEETEQGLAPEDMDEMFGFGSTSEEVLEQL